MISVIDAALDVFKPDNSTNTPDFTIPEEDLEVVDFDERIGREKDEGQIVIRNDDGRYSPALDTDKPLRSGDRVEFRASTEAGLNEWGANTWGDGVWGGQMKPWTAWIRDRKFIRHSPSISTIELQCEDFVGGIMSKRLVYNNFDEIQISGSDDSIITTIMENEAPEIDISRVETFEDTATLNSDGKTLLDVVNSLARRANAYTYQEREFLRMDSIAGVDTQFEITGDDIHGFSNEDRDTGLVNRVRVDGGRSRAIDDEQLTQSSYVTVTEDNQFTFQVSTRKIAIERLEIWTRKGDNEENLTLRIQKSNAAGDGPIAPDDTTSDIDNRSLSHEFISNDDLTTFIFGKDHELPEPNPWIIVETDGDEGHEIGVNGSNIPAYKVWYAYNITVRKSNHTSRRKYRLREYRIKEEGAQSLEEALQLADEKLDHDSEPESAVHTEPDSYRAHFLRLGDVVELDFPRENVVGQYVITDRALTYEGIGLHVSFKLQEVGTI